MNIRSDLLSTKIFSSKFIAIALLISIALINSGSSLIYAKENPVYVANQPHDYNKFVCGTRADHSLHSKAILDHALNLKRLSGLQRAPSISADFDDGDVAVLVDDGTLLRPTPANPFDLDGLTLLFTPNGNGSYDVDAVEFTFDGTFGTDVGAGDDTNHEFNLTGGFSFPYFGSTWTNIWVRANGNVTFGAIGNPQFYDPADFNLELPMIAPFFGDLDPSSGGSVHAKEEATKFTVTWNAVAEFGVSNSNTFQLVLKNDGSFLISYNGIGVTIPANGNLIVGFNSGRANAVVEAVDLSAVPINGDINDIIFEFFKPLDPFPTVDALAIFKKFYETHDDIYDQIILFTNFTSDIANFAGAFHLAVSNSVQGLNRLIFDNSAAYGSGGRLQSYLNMNQLSFWASDPYFRFSSNGGFNFLNVMGQESGHRWLSALRFDKGSGNSDLLLGRKLLHWSTFLKFEVSSTMDGGNNWEEITPNTFENKSWVDYYSNLDQYAMGLRAPEEVPPFYYISSTSNNTLAARTPGTVSLGTIASGERVDVTIEEVIAAEGPRLPLRDASQKDFQQAFILLVQQGTLPSTAELSKLNGWIDAWRDHWVIATDGRSTLSTSLDAVLAVAAVEGMVTDATTDQPLNNISAKNLDIGVEQTVAGGGYYRWRTLAAGVGEPDGSFTQVISAYPYYPDTSIVPVTFNSTITRNISLTGLPTGSLAGTISNSNTGTPLEALVVLNAFSDIIGAFDIEVSTDGTGNYSFTDLYITQPGVISYKGITVFPDFPAGKTEFFGPIIDDGMITTMNLEVEAADILLVNGDPNGGYNYFYTNILDSMNITYNKWLTKEKGLAPAPAAATETVYPIIIWYTGDETGNSMSIEEENNLISFLDAGGRLFITGQNIVENLSPSSTLLTNYLQVTHGGNSTEVTAISVGGNSVTDGEGIFSFSGVGGANNQTSADILIPTGIAADALTYGTSKTEIAAVTVDDGNSKIFLTGFGFEGLASNANNSTSPDQLMFRALTWFGIQGLVSVEDEIVSSLPKKYSLKQNYPNPFNPITTIEYEIASVGEVRLIIYNLLGQEVAKLVDGTIPAGKHQVIWDASGFATGIYFYRMEIENFIETHKLILLK